MKKKTGWSFYWNIQLMDKLKRRLEICRKLDSVHVKVAPTPHTGPLYWITGTSNRRNHSLICGLKSMKIAVNLAKLVNSFWFLSGWLREAIWYCKWCKSMGVLNLWLKPMFQLMRSNKGCLILYVYAYLKNNSIYYTLLHVGIPLFFFFYARTYRTVS